MLIKNFGNLFQRLLKILKPVQVEINEYLLMNKNSFNKKLDCVEMLNKFVSEWNFDLYHNYLNNLISASNKDLTDKKPWTLELKEQIPILAHMVEDFYLIMCLMYPIIPTKVFELGSHLGWDKFNLCLEQIKLSIIENSNKIIAFEYIKTVCNEKTLSEKISKKNNPHKK